MDEADHILHTFISTRVHAYQGGKEETMINLGSFHILFSPSLPAYKFKKENAERKGP